MLVYSDGVSDNLYKQHFLDCFKGRITPEGLLTSYSEVADCIARSAYWLGKDRMFFSPFSKGAKEAGMNRTGGKHDDITITVGQLFTTEG